jgi:hypothetical protein
MFLAEDIEEAHLSRDARTPMPEQLILLRRNLTDYLSDNDLRELCSKMRIDYERLRGQGKAARASELVRHLAARGRILELVALASQLRPDISWGDMAGDLATSPVEEPASSRRIGAALGWLVVVLVVVAGLALVLGGGLHVGRPGIAPSPALHTPGPAPITSTPTAPTSMPVMAAVTATPLWTPASPTETLVPPTETFTPPRVTETAEQVPTGTPTPPASARSSVPRVVTLQAPLDGVCTKSPIITFKWTGVALRPGESFLVVITPQEVNTGKCSRNYASGVQYSPLLRSYEWTTDISAPPRVPAACAGIVEWTVYISGAAGKVTQVAPFQSYEWNPLKCAK